MDGDDDDESAVEPLRKKRKSGRFGGRLFDSASESSRGSRRSSDREDDELTNIDDDDDGEAEDDAKKRELEEQKKQEEKEEERRHQRFEECTPIRVPENPLLSKIVRDGDRSGEYPSFINKNRHVNILDAMRDSNHPLHKVYRHVGSSLSGMSLEQAVKNAVQGISVLFFLEFCLIGKVKKN